MAVDQEESFVEAIRRHAVSRPKPALAEPGTRALSYRELYEQLADFSAAFRRHGLIRTSRVAVATGEPPFDRACAASALLGVAASAVAVPIDPSWTLPELRRFLCDARVDAVLSLDTRSTTAAAEAANELGLRHIAACLRPNGAAGALDVSGAEGAPQTPEPRPDDVAILLYTSGTTARSKLVPLTHRMLATSATNIARHLWLTQEDRCLNPMPLFHSHGIVGGLLASLVSGGQVICTGRFDVDVFVDAIARFDPTWYTAAPTIHERFVSASGQYRQKAPRHAFRFVRSASSGLPATTLSALQSMTGAPVIESYGMTESATQVASNPLPPGVAKTGSVGRAAGAELKVVDETGALVSAGVTGEIAVRGPALFRGYDNDDEATAAAIRDGWFYTGDLGRFDEDGYLFVVGRLKEIINRGGEKISPIEVELALLDNPRIAQAAVFPAPHRTLGDDVHALVVLREGCAESALEIRRALVGRIADFKIPTKIVVAQAIPVGPTGKVERLRLHQQITSATGASRAVLTAPRSAVEATLAAIWRDVLGLEQVGVHDDFFERGGDSLTATQIVLRVRLLLRKDVSLRLIFECRTIAEAALAIDDSVDLAKDQAASLLLPSEGAISGDLTVVSYSQRRMWLLHQEDPEGAAYNMRRTVVIRGDLDRDRLRRAVQMLLARHEAFRTTFRMEPGWSEPMARIASPFDDASALPITEFEFAGHASESWRHAIEHELASFARQPFDLDRGPLHRIALVRASAVEHVLMIVMHHSIGDAWSFGILLRELASIERALASGDPARLAEPAVTYADYARWQRARSTTDALQSDLAYWLGELKGAPRLELPTDMPAAHRQTRRGAMVAADLSATLLDSLRAACARHAVSPYMATFATFAWLLSRYCGQTDVVIATPVAGREAVETEGVVGTFVNTVVVRLDLTGVSTVSALLDRVKEKALSALAHQNLPFDYLVEQMRVQHGGVDAIDVMFNVANTPSSDLIFSSGATLEYAAVDVGTAQFPLQLTLSFETEKRAYLAFSTEVFERSTAESLLQRYLTLTERMLERPDARLDELTLLLPAEAERLRGWNDTATPVPDDTVSSLIEKRAIQCPSKTAIISPRQADASVTYGELLARVRQWARVFIAKGARNGTLVGIHLERSVSMVVAQLAVLQTGAAYVPLDPAYPPTRLQYMADDAGLALVVSESALLGGLSWPRERTVLIDLDEAVADCESSAPFDHDIGAGVEDAAYVIYTSGSTGKPKGVAVPHRAVVNLLVATADRPGMGSDDTLLAVTTLSFDIAVLELLLPLYVGATVVLADRDDAADGATLRHLIDQHDVTVFQATPATWRLLAEAGLEPKRRLKGLIGGESLPPDLARTLTASVGELWNVYGPTETTVWSTAWKVESIEAGILIGRPLANTEVHVVDDVGRVCPPGVPGEIVIGGLGVAIGYLNRPELTAERFVGDRFSDRPGGRVYRTGDRGRWRRTGQLEHLGRLDHQVKVRGHRIELGEIENAIAAQAGVGEVVVVVREDRQGDARIVAYVVARDPGSELSPRVLRDQLRTLLPNYMVPQHFVLLERIPRLPNGKTDRKELPRPSDDTAGLTESPDSLPSSDAERSIAAVWSELLGVQGVLRTDNFFDLGGHSLLAIRAIAQLEQRLGVRFPPRRFVFESLAQLAASVRDEGGEGSPDSRGSETATAGDGTWIERLRSRLWRH